MCESMCVFPFFIHLRVVVKSYNVTNVTVLLQEKSCINVKSHELAEQLLWGIAFADLVNAFSMHAH